MLTSRPEASGERRASSARWTCQGMSGQRHNMSGEPAPIVAALTPRKGTAASGWLYSHTVTRVSLRKGCRCLSLSWPSGVSRHTWCAAAARHVSASSGAYSSAGTRSLTSSAYDSRSKDDRICHRERARIAREWGGVQNTGRKLVVCTPQGPESPESRAGEPGQPGERMNVRRALDLRRGARRVERRTSSSLAFSLTRMRNSWEPTPLKNSIIEKTSSARLSDMEKFSSTK